MCNLTSQFVNRCSIYFDNSQWNLKVLTRGKRHRKRVGNDDGEYDDPDDDVSDIYSRFVSEWRVFVKRARARVCHLVVVSLG